MFEDHPTAGVSQAGHRGPLGWESRHISITLPPSPLGNRGLVLLTRADYAIVMEEDLDVSPDFFTYFAQTMPLMAQDETLYCISAWNDQGYKHTSQDPTQLYRVETLPGLGWLLKRSMSVPLPQRIVRSACT